MQSQLNPLQFQGATLQKFMRVYTYLRHRMQALKHVCLIQNVDKVVPAPSLAVEDVINIPDLH